MNRFTRAADALGIRLPNNFHSRLAKLTAVLVAISSIWLYVGVAEAATLSSASVALTDTQPQATGVNYNFTASGFTASPTKIYCIQETFSDNSDGTGGVPGSMSTTAAGTNPSASTLITPGNFTVDGTAANGKVVYNDASGQAPLATSAVTFNVSNITNPVVGANGVYWMTFATYTAVSSGGVCGGSVIDSTVVGFNITSGSQMTLTIDPTLTFSIGLVGASTTCNGATTTAASTATTIPFGVVSSAANSIVCQAVTAATNATNGYTVYLRDTGQLANTLNQTLADFSSGSNATPVAFSSNGTEAYGYTSASTSESQFQSNKWAGFNHTAGGNSSANNEPIATYSTPQASSTFDVGFQAGVSNTTKPGNYQTTVVYTCTPIY